MRFIEAYSVRHHHIYRHGRVSGACTSRRSDDCFISTTDNKQQMKPQIYTFRTHRDTRTFYHHHYDAETKQKNLL